jgi:hypothetical protein
MTNHRGLTNMKILKIVGSLVIAFYIAGSAYAHHSATGVDQTKTATAEGLVKQFKWANPHAWIEIETPKADGKGVDLRSFEMTAPSFLVRAGWKATTLKAGDKVKVTYRPMKDTEKDGLGGLFQSITLPDGKVLTQQAPRGGGAAPAAPAAQPPATK